MNKKDGGAAFPENGFGEGMTLRDYFAAKAMQALLHIHDDVMKITDTAGFVSLHFRAYEHADAMLKAREQ